MGLAYDPGRSASRTARRCIRRVAGRAAEACLTHNFVGVHSGTLAHRRLRSLGGVRERRRGLAADNRGGLVNQFDVV